ncbi:MAG: hypothetical protein ACYTDX_01685, partial [Planctomycetota bacterium]
QHGKGKVLHLLGHAWQKQGNLKGTYGMQRIVLNFLLDRGRTLPPRPSSAGSAIRREESPVRRKPGR